MKYSDSNYVLHAQSLGMNELYELVLYSKIMFQNKSPCGMSEGGNVSIQ